MFGWSRKQTERMEKQEIAHVRGLGEAAEDRRRGGWIKTNRAEDELFEEHQIF